MKQHQLRLSAVGLLGLAVGSQGFASLVLLHGRRLQLERAATTSAITSSSDDNCSSSATGSTNINYHRHHQHQHHVISNGVRSSALSFSAYSNVSARGGAGLMRFGTGGRPGHVLSAAASSSASMKPEPQADEGGDGGGEAVDEGEQEEEEQAGKKKRAAVRGTTAKSYST